MHKKDISSFDNDNTGQTESAANGGIEQTASAGYPSSDNHEVVLLRHQLLSGVANDVVFFIHPNGIIIDSNESASFIYGYSREEFKGMNVERLLPDYLVKEAKNEMFGEKSAGTLFQTEHKRKDGTIFPVEMSSQGAVLDGRSAFLTVIRDVSDRIRAQRAIENYVQRINNILESIPDAFMSVDKDWNITYTNHAAHKLIGDWRQGRYEHDFWKVFGDMFSVSEQFTIRYAMEHRTSLSLEATTLDGLRCWEIRIHPIKSGLSFYLNDITVRRNVESQKEKARIALENVYNRERRIAETLQRVFLPDAIPKVDGYEIADAYEPALDEARIGGDIYDVFMLPDGRLGLFMADVSGSGLMAARQGAVVKYSLRTCAFSQKNPAESLRLLNDILYDKLSEDTFITCFFGILEPLTGNLIYANAGHEEPIIVRAASTVELTQVTGPALNVLSDPSYTVNTALLQPGDVVCMYTDGVTDARGAGERMEQKGLIRLLSSCCNENPYTIVDTVLAEVKIRSGIQAADDVAVLVVKSTKSPQGHRHEGT